MNTQVLIRGIEHTIKTKEEHEYFLIHVARYAHILNTITTIAEPEKKLRVLDVGCFPYHLGTALESMGYDVYGIASGHEPIKNKNISVINIEKDRFPHKDGFFDFVIFTEVLEHIPQSPLLALKEMARVTKPGGHLILTTPNIARSINRGMLAMGKSIMYPVDNLLENEGRGSTIYMRHNREYTMDELKRLVSSAGWTVAESEYFVSYTPFRKRTRQDRPLLWFGKFVNYLAMEIVPSFRDTLLVVGGK